MSDTLQAGACIFLPFHISCDHLTPISCLQFPPAGMIILFQVCSLYVPTKDRSPLRGHFWESSVFRLHSKLARSILALKISVTTTTNLCNIFWNFSRVVVTIKYSGGGFLCVKTLYTSGHFGIVKFAVWSIICQSGKVYKLSPIYYLRTG